MLIQPIEQPSKKSSGLLLPETAKEKPQTGLVAVIGDDEEIKLKVNDKILFAECSGNEFKLDGTEYLLLESSDLAGTPISMVSANSIALSGGVWQNITLLRRTLSSLRSAGFQVYLQYDVPINDGVLQWVKP